MGIDLTNWDEEVYKEGILQERESQCRTIFRAIFAPNSNPNPDIIVAASSDGSVASYSISSCLTPHGSGSEQLQVAEPRCFLRAHDGPAYDVKLYENAENSLLLSCGDDGRILGWNWNEILMSDASMQSQKLDLEPVLELTNPQHKGPWGALSPIPENNAIAIDNQAGSIYAAAGDSCAYCWDLETSKIKNIFKGHTDYVHSVVTRKSCNQVITCSEDGSARIWDTRSRKCVQVISPKRDKQRKETSCITSLALDSSENWLAFGSGQNLYVWNLLVQEQILRISTHMSTQDVLFHDNEILAVGAKPVLSRYDMNGTVLSQIQCAPQSAFSVSLHPSGVVAVAGYGGLVDVVSQFGSHMCTFGSKSV
ncbi:hypothetical protein V2J09_002506 [Rumex salicifolius]